MGLETRENDDFEVIVGEIIHKIRRSQLRNRIKKQEAAKIRNKHQYADKIRTWHQTLVGKGVGTAW